MRTKLPPDPDNMNEERSEWAGAALCHFQQLTGAEDEEAFGDLLCDLMHWADRNNFDFEAALTRSRGCYEEETADMSSGSVVFAASSKNRGGEK